MLERRAEYERAAKAATRAKAAMQKHVVRNKWRVVMDVSSAARYMQESAEERQHDKAEQEKKVSTDARRKAQQLLKTRTASQKRRCTDTIRLRVQAGEAVSFKSRRKVTMADIDESLSRDKTAFAWMNEQVLRMGNAVKGLMKSKKKRVKKFRHSKRPDNPTPDSGVAHGTVAAAAE